MGSSAVGVSSGDILLYSSDQVTGRIGDETVSDPPDFSCEAQRTGPGGLPGQGQITSRALELAGPDTVPAGGVPGGYVPCFFTVPDGGSTNNIYYVAFLGPSGANSNAECVPATGCTGEVDLVSPANFDASQKTSVSAWDVTVRSALTSTQDITGRLFADYLSMITGVSSRPLYSMIDVLTTDGYIYDVSMRGLDPYGFVVYSNDTGFLNTDGSPLLQDVLADPTIPTQQQNQLNVLQGGVSLAEPTHHIFFNQPSVEARLALNGLVDPVAPVINTFVFNGVLSDNNTLVGAGGTFDLTVNVRGVFLLVISQDGVNFDPNLPTNSTLIGVGSAGSQQIAWDGLDNAGNLFPVGLDYPARIVLRAGEVHFPLLDVENSQEGGPQYQLINPPGGICPPLFPAGCFTGFYDDRGYTTADGTDVGTPGVELPGVSPPPVPNSDPFLGFDTRSGDRAFGNGSQAGFGDKKGLDLWTYYPTEAETPLNIFAEAPPTPTATATATATPTPTITPTPTPTSPPDDGNGDDDKEEPTPTSPPRITVATPAPPPPAPTPAVLLLPETGIGYSKTVPVWPLLVLPGLGLLMGWVVYRRRRDK